MPATPPCVVVSARCAWEGMETGNVTPHGSSPLLLRSSLVELAFHRHNSGVGWGTGSCAHSMRGYPPAFPSQRKQEGAAGRCAWPADAHALLCFKTF